ncbi:group II intron reverse transcriptase/maturase [Nitrosomonas communis]|uniref:Group II intron reverse transcriptase/maturase n=1 Tax=Nitrosomonas communis TaxID=44574 RepID=A0A1H2XJW8_9PROT|nr:group II intron reverse transcriptase/maturase [Nitrosomonas communis]SDW92998.1 group II intron reverse transcriptase/maturase [Nitrosomonas communis]
MPEERRRPVSKRDEESNKSEGIDVSLPTLMSKVQTLQTSLQTKAKAEPAFRFYSLWDKVYRDDVLRVAYRRCRANRGAPGYDGISFKQIEDQGVDEWLERLQQELRVGGYQPQPLLRVWIPKAQGGQRPLGIPTIRDRVVQMAVLLVLGPIFEVDLLPRQYGFRPGLDAKMAIRAIHFGITQRGKREVVDGDLSDYFNTIPHGELMRCVSRRVSDGTVLSVIRKWLKVAVIERDERGERRTTEAKDKQRGTPQGGIISPLLSNLYFRRFLLAWQKFGFGQRLRAEVVNYADDLVILCPNGCGEKAMAAMRHLMSRLGLMVNEKKTRLVKLPDEHFDFLGYTLGQFYGKDGRPYWGTRPSKKAIKRLKQGIHNVTSSRWNASSVDSRIAELNLIIRGWTNYFNQGPVSKIYRNIRDYTERRLRIWLMRKHGKRGTGYRQYPDEYLYDILGLYRLPLARNDLLNAKA